MDKKILTANIENEMFEQIKIGNRNTIIIEYSKPWLEKLSYPCGTFKQYDLVSIQNQEHANVSTLLYDFKGADLIKEKSGWLKTKKHFEIKLGEKIKE